MSLLGTPSAGIMDHSLRDDTAMKGITYYNRVRGICEDGLAWKIEKSFSFLIRHCIGYVYYGKICFG